MGYREPIDPFCTRAFIVDMVFSSGYRRAIAIGTDEATDIVQAERIALAHFDYAARSSGPADRMQERIFLYGYPTHVVGYRDTPQRREMLGIEQGPSKYMKALRPPQGWYA